MAGTTTNNHSKINWLVWWPGVLLGIGLLLIIVLWYWKLNNQEKFETTDTTTTRQVPNYPFIWKLDKTNQLIDKKNTGRHVIYYCKDNLTDKTATKSPIIPSNNILLNEPPALFKGINLDFSGQIIGLNTKDNTTEYLQVIYNKPDLPTTTTIPTISAIT